MAALVCALASASAEDAPQVSLSVPPPFATDVTVKHYRQGQDLLDDPTLVDRLVVRANLSLTVNPAGRGSGRALGGDAQRT